MPFDGDVPGSIIRKIDTKAFLLVFSCFSKSGFALALVAASAVSASCADLAVLRNGYSIRHQRREALGPETRLYLGKDASSFVDVPSVEIERIEPDLTPETPAASPAVTPALPDLVNDASSRYRLDPDLVNSVIRAESGFQTRAVSPKGAKGLMQLMPGTASELGVKDAMDPESNLDGGARYLRRLIEQYDFDLVKALAAYNAGPHRVDQYRGVPPYRETRAYVARIIRDFNRRKTEQERAAKLAAAPRRKRASATPSRRISTTAAAVVAAPTVAR